MGLVSKNTIFAALGALASFAFAFPAHAEQPRIFELSCDAYNAYGFAKMVYEPATHELVATVNFGQLVLRYKVEEMTAAAVQPPSPAPLPVIGGIKLSPVKGAQEAEGESRPTYKLQFSEGVSLSKRQVIGGTFSLLTTYQHKDGEEVVTKEALTPISVVSCAIQLEP